MAERLASLKRRAAEAGSPVIYVNDIRQWQSDLTTAQALSRYDVRGPPSGRNPTALPKRIFVLKPKHSGFSPQRLIRCSILERQDAYLDGSDRRHLRAFHRQRRLHARFHLVIPRTASPPAMRREPPRARTDAQSAKGRHPPLDRPRPPQTEKASRTCWRRDDRSTAAVAAVRSPGMNRSLRSASTGESVDARAGGGPYLLRPQSRTAQHRRFNQLSLTGDTLHVAHSSQQGLSICFFLLFFSLVGQALTGHQEYNQINGA